MKTQTTFFIAFIAKFVNKLRTLFQAPSSVVMVVLLTAFCLNQISCRSNEILPEKIEVKVTREAADKDCKPLGLVQGKSTKINPTSEEVLEDMKKDAALKGANLVVYETMGSFGGYMRGQAYFCP